MKLALDYRAEYRYERKVGLSPHNVRLFPRDALQARVVVLDFATNPSGAVHWRHDLFDNVVAQCFYPREEDHLLYTLRAEVAVEVRNPFGFLLESRALQWPAEYTGRERALLASFLTTGENTGSPALCPLPGREMVGALAAMNQWIQANVAYERREDGDAHAPVETLRLRRGACRDTAVLLAAALRAGATRHAWSAVICGKASATPPSARRRVPCMPGPRCFSPAPVGWGWIPPTACWSTITTSPPPSA